MPRIINYHQIRDSKWFSQSLDILQNRYAFSPPEALEHYYSGAEIKEFFTLTVDDGDLSNYDIILPELRKRGLKALIFVSPEIAKTGRNFWFQEIEGYDPERLRRSVATVIQKEIPKDFYPPSVLKCLRIDQIWEIIRHYQKENGVVAKPSRNMNISQLRELQSSGHFLIGAHTLTHPILANETPEESRRQIVQSVTELEEILGQKVEHFAYPNGDPEIDFGVREKEFLKEAGVRWGYSFRFSPLSKKDDPLAIPRFGLDYGNEAYIRRRMSWGPAIEWVKRNFLGNETRHRREIQRKLGF